jgi:GDP-L-fucose synthase
VTVVLITGGSGLLGTWLRIKAPDSFVIHAPSHEELDLLNKEEVINYFTSLKPDICIHAAAIVYGIGGNLELGDLVESNNSRIDDNVIEAIELCVTSRFIYISSVAAYGHPYVRVPLQEKDLLVGMPHSSELGYARVKREALGKILASTNRNLSYSYCIMTNLFGEYDRFDSERGHVIPSLIARSHGSNSLEVWNDLDQSRDFLYAADAAEIIWQLCSINFIGLINIASGVERTIKEVATSVAKFSGTMNIVSNKTNVAAIRNRAIDVSVLKNLLDYQYTDFEIAIERTVKWYSTNR